MSAAHVPTIKISKRKMNNSTIISAQCSSLHCKQVGVQGIYCTLQWHSSATFFYPHTIPHIAMELHCQDILFSDYETANYRGRDRRTDYSFVDLCDTADKLLHLTQPNHFGCLQFDCKIAMDDILNISRSRC